MEAGDRLVRSGGSLKSQSVILTLTIMEAYVKWNLCQRESLSHSDGYCGQCKGSRGIEASCEVCMHVCVCECVYVYVSVSV